MMIKKENQSSSWINKRKIFIYIYIQILKISFFDKKKCKLEKKIIMQFIWFLIKYIKQTNKQKVILIEKYKIKKAK